MTRSIDDLKRWKSYGFNMTPVANPIASFQEKLIWFNYFFNNVTFCQWVVCFCEILININVDSNDICH